MRALALFLSGAAVFGQAPPAAPQISPNDQVLKALDDVEWRLKLGDVADVDKIAYTSLPPAHNPNPTGPGAGNPLIIRAYTFIPKKLDRSKKQPLLVLAHQGIHGNVSSDELGHIMRELMEQGYAVIAPIIAAPADTALVSIRRSITEGARSTTCSPRASGCWTGTAFWMRNASA